MYTRLGKKALGRNLSRKVANFGRNEGEAIKKQRKEEGKAKNLNPSLPFLILKFEPKTCSTQTKNFLKNCKLVFIYVLENITGFRRKAKRNSEGTFLIFKEGIWKDPSRFLQKEGRKVNSFFFEEGSLQKDCLPQRRW